MAQLREEEKELAARLLDNPIQYNFEQYRVIRSKIKLLNPIESYSGEDFNFGLYITIKMIAEKYCNHRYTDEVESAAANLAVCILTGLSPLAYLLSEKN